MLTGKGLADLIRTYTRTTTTTFPDSEMIGYVNVAILEVAQALKEKLPEALGMPAVTDLIADQREYPFPAQMLSTMIKLEAKLDGINWIPLTEMKLNINYNRTTNESEITSRFANIEGNAFYDIFAGSLVLYCGSITNVTDGLKLMYVKMPKKLSTSDLVEDTRDLSQPPTTTDHGIREELQEFVARNVSISWKGNKDKPIPLSKREMMYEVDLDKALSRMSVDNTDGSFIVPMPDDGSDNGHKY